MVGQSPDHGRGVRNKRRLCGFNVASIHVATILACVYIFIKAQVSQLFINY